MIKISQLPPGPEAMPTGMPPMPGDPTAPQGQPQQTFKIIYSPLDSVGKILADLDFKSFLQNHFGSNSFDLAMKIWEMYGGSPKEGVPGKKGTRLDTPQSDDMTQQTQAQENEYNATRDKRWLRLPRGKSIDEITDTNTLEKAITGGFEILSKSLAKPAQADTITDMVRIAAIAEKNKDFAFADKIDFILRNVWIS